MHNRISGAGIRCLLACAFFWPVLSLSAPDVVVSIKPLHSLVAGVMAGVAKPELLLPGVRSPHDLQLTPSDVRKLTRADRIFWIGRTLETPLPKILRANTQSSNSVELLAAPGIETLPLRGGGLWAKPEHDRQQAGHGAAAGQATAEGGDDDPLWHLDPHIWLSPANAARIVRLVIDELSRVDPEHAADYRKNGELLLQRIREMDRLIAGRLSMVSSVPYVVFHDAYRYFEHHYRLNAVAALSVSPEHLPGARRVAQLRSTIILLKARCVFSEPQFEPKLVRTLVQGTGAGTARLDPLGADLPPGPEAYFSMMDNLSRALLDCLGRADG